MQKYIETNITTIPIFLRAKPCQECDAFWSSPTRLLDVTEALRKRKRLRVGNHERDHDAASESAIVSSIDQEADPTETIRRLQQELTRATSTIQRWETVNNKLLDQLQSSKK
jgi:hypothetical protein